MDKKDYKVLTDNWPRKNPVGIDTVVSLTEAEAKYSVLSGDLQLVPAKEKPGRKPKIDPPPGGAGEGAGGNGEGEGA